MTTTTTAKNFQRCVQIATAKLGHRNQSANEPALPKLIQVVELLKLQATLRSLGLPVVERVDSTRRNARSNLDSQPDAYAPSVDTSTFDFRKRERFLMRKYCQIWSTFLDSELYISWRDGRKWELCCYGEPGCGKSTLAAAIAENVRSWYPNGRAVVIAMFLDDKDKKGRRLFDSPVTDPLTAFRLNILKQLSDYGEPHAAAHVAIPGKSLITDARSDLASAIDLRLEALRNTNGDLKIFFVIDGFDGCPEIIRACFTQEISRIGGHLATTRQQPLSLANERGCDVEGCNSLISDIFFQCPQCGPSESIDICQACYTQKYQCITHGNSFEEPYDVLGFEMRSLDSQIIRYVRWEIERELLTTPLGRELSQTEDILQRIETTIADKAKGALVIARVFMEYLIQEQSLHELFDSLSHVSLPEAAYFKLLVRRVSSQSPQDRELGLVCLQIISTAYSEAERSNIRYDELVEAVRISGKSTLGLKSQSNLLQVTRSLVTISPYGLGIEPFHESLATFLYEECSEVFEKNKIDMSELCLRSIRQALLRLRSDGLDLAAMADCFETDPFLSYAVQSLGYHLAQNPTATATKAALDLMRDEHELACFLLMASLAESADEEQNQPWWLWPGCQPVHVCAFFGLVDVLEGLKSSTELDVDRPDPVFGRSPLIIACKQGHHDIAQKLLELGADTMQTCSQGRTAIQETIENGGIDTFESLMNKHLDLSRLPEESRIKLLFSAIEHTDTYFIRQLLGQTNLDPNTANSQGTTLLMHAIATGLTEHVKILLGHSAVNLAQTNKRQETALHVAARVDASSVREVVQAIRKQDKSNLLDVKDQKGRTAAMVAIESYQTDTLEVLKVLKIAGSDFNLTDNLERSMAHYLAAHCHDEQCLQLVECQEAKLNVRDQRSWTPLHAACCARNTSAVAHFLAKGASCCIRDKYGRTPLDICQLYDPLDVSSITSKLQSHSLREITFPLDAPQLVQPVARTDGGLSNVNARSEGDAAAPIIELSVGNTALHTAAVAGDTEAAIRILDEGHVSVNGRNFNGHTALSLHCARYDGPELEMVELLLKHGAEPRCVAHEEQDPFTFAKSQKCWEVALAIFEHDASDHYEIQDLRSLFEVAINMDRTDLIKRLLDRGVNVLQHFKDGTLPLQFAKEAQASDDIVAFLEIKQREALRNIWPKVLTSGS